ncbi:tyrosine-type recombinase/integrase [Novosphingobium beihaiensis]|uniref:Integrase arm-type DNA-binding domain-containing protein n=1 Tax=Novosphingobium beihaiensis TaxID=2930389 RepID=A0ABT0BRV9_9SPHN|nr:integrase arm-type DNA-binding domain-containing protein [Novosphingobium beihaiensis]MCJ2187703.1 integrase arm-type DNA-binding domain-containing protein [Novosphingobium beihaiensis]
MLTDRECKTAGPSTKDRKLFDGEGLFLLVTKAGFKSWRLKYRYGGKEKLLTFGPYPQLSLKEARQRKDEARAELFAGRDPGELLKKSRARRLGKEEETGTFRAAALEWLRLQQKGWKAKHHAAVQRSLERDIFPAIGALQLTSIRPADIRPVIDAVQRRGAVDTAHRLLWRIKSVFDLAIAAGEAEINPAASIQAILQPQVLGRCPAILEIKRARQFLLDFEALPGQPATKLASRLLALTASRPGPLRLAQAAEFLDLDGSDPRWRIPAEKMKLELAESEQTAFDFTIPLSRQAVETVKVAMSLAANRDYLFPSPRFSHRPISDNTLNVAYRRLTGYEGEHVPHGWRSSFSTIMNERAADLGRPGDRAVIDLMLAHKPRGTEAHYNRAAYMRQRRIIAQEWADLLCEGLPSPATLADCRRRT